MQDKSTVAGERLSGCLHIQDLAPLPPYVSPQRAQVAKSLSEIRLRAPFGLSSRNVPEGRRQQCGQNSRNEPLCRWISPRDSRFQNMSNCSQNRFDRRYYLASIDGSRK